MKTLTLFFTTALLFVASSASAQTLVEKIKTMKDMTVITKGVADYGEMCASFMLKNPSASPGEVPTCLKYLAYSKALTVRSNISGKFAAIDPSGMPSFTHKAYKVAVASSERATSVTKRLDAILKSR